MPTPFKSEQLDHFLYDVKKERFRQEEKWRGRINNSFKWLAILMEELGELSMALLDKNKENAYNELVQVAAVACAWGEQVIEGHNNEEIRR